ncbi:MAG: response regulator [Anaerolineae bacterium]|nr:response regulator [Anaerolineae bacterium]MDW7992572.1 response regulator [Anaerolineae bacterium]
MAQHRILIVDANEGFATLLQEEVERMGDMSADVVSTGQDALRATMANRYTLAIVDMDLPDLPAPQLVRALHSEHPDLRLMVIPLEGDRVPAELTDVPIQGTLSKPFFLPELPERIRQALAAPLTVQKEPPKEESARAAPAVEDFRSAALSLMSQLAREVGAEAILLIQNGELLAHTGRMSENGVLTLTSLVSDAWRTSTRVAQVLGKESLRFEQSIEGAEYLLYSLAIVENLILSIVVAGRVPLGIIRHRAKETAEEIRRLMSGISH